MEQSHANLKPGEYRFDDHNGMQQPQHRPKRRKWPIVLGIILTSLAVIIGIYVFLIVRSVVNISTNPMNFAGVDTDIENRTNILVLGKGDPGHAGANLTDTVMVLSIDTRTKQVAQISLPRDLRVPVPGFGNYKINQASALGGPDLARETVSEVLDLPIHYTVQTNFSGLRGVVDAVGGLDVDVKQRLVDPEYPCEDNQYRSCGLVIEQGLQHMDGARVLQYTRCRKGTCGNDFGRAARQQEIISLLRTRITDWSVLLNPFKLEPITGALHDSLETDLGSFQMVQLALIWQSTGDKEPIRLVLHTGPGGYLRSSGTSDLVPVGGSFSTIQKRIDTIFTDPPSTDDLP